MKKVLEITEIIKKKQILEIVKDLAETNKLVNLKEGNV